MQFESFWVDDVKKFGGKALRPPRIIQAQSMFKEFGLAGRVYSARRRRMDPDLPPRLKRSYEHTLAQWQRRRQFWSEMRSPWYPVDYRLWSLSPWSWISARKIITAFKLGHSQKNLARCMSLARTILSYESFHTQFVNTQDEHPVLWLFLSIASLMVATIPSIPTDLNMTRPAKPLANFPNSRCTVPPNLISSTGIITMHPVRLTTMNTTYTVPTTSWLHPSERLQDFVNTFYPGAKKHPVPRAWLDETMNCGRAVWNRHASGTHPDDWLPFDFEIPEYDTQWAMAVDTGYSNNGLSILGWVNSAPPTSDTGRFVSPPDSPIVGDSDLDQLPSPTAPGKTIHRKRGGRHNDDGDDDDTDSESTRTVGVPKHYTVSEVGNHLFKHSTWVVEPDGNLGYDVYRITKSCQKLGYSTAKRIRSQLLTVGPHGPMLRSDGSGHAAQIRAEFRKSIQPIGKLLMYKRHEEIAEHNGKNGMPLWISVGTDVYDVTKFSFDSSQEQEDLTRAHDGKPIKLPDSSEDYEKLIRRLFPFRCALMSGAKKTKPRVLYPFTRKMLSWHDNPFAGCYTAIGDIVYDLTPYLECHPGGKDIIIKYLGKEAVEFDDYHKRELLDSYPEFQIGRLVPEIQLDQIQKHHVAIHEWLYDISGLAPTESNDKRHHQAYEKVSKFGGTDASEDIKKGGRTAMALSQLVLEEHDRIVGKVVRPGDEKLKEIPDGELPKHTDPMSLQGAWTVVDGLVYEVSGLMRYGTLFYGEKLPRAFAGKTLTDRALAIWLAQTHPYRVVGRLVSGPEWPDRTIGELFDIKVDPVQEAKEKALRDIEELKKQGHRIPPGMVEAANSIGAAAGKADEPIWTGPIPQDLLDWARAEGPTATEFKNKLKERKRELEAQNTSSKRKTPAGAAGSQGSGRSTRRKVGP